MEARYNWGQGQTDRQQITGATRTPVQLRYADVWRTEAFLLPRPDRLCFTYSIIFTIYLRFNIGYRFPTIGLLTYLLHGAESRLRLCLSLRFLHQNPICNSPHPHTYYMSGPSHSSRFDYPNIIRLGVSKVIKPSLCTLPHYTVSSFVLGPNILLRTNFLNTLSLSSSLNVGDQVSHPYKTQAKLQFCMS